MEAFYIILGLGMLYIMVHFYVIQFNKTWKQRSGYEKFMTIATAAMLVLMFIGSME